MSTSSPARFAAWRSSGIHDDGHAQDQRDARARRPAPEPARTAALERDLLARNERIAADNRALLTAHGITMINVMSSPGAGKSTLIARAIRRLSAARPVAVIAGDQQPEAAAIAIGSAGAPVVHLDTRDTSAIPCVRRSSIWENAAGSWSWRSPTARISRRRTRTCSARQAPWS